MKKRLMAFALLCASFHSAFALSLKDAGENLLYFEHAKLSAEHCERQQIAVRPAFDNWQQQTMPLYRQSTDAIRAEGAKRGLSRSEQEDVLAAAIENQRQLAQDNIARKGVACKNFGAVLEMYSTLLKR